MKLFNEQQLQSKIEENKIKISSKADFQKLWWRLHTNKV